jgi:hypothetical protein
MLPTGGRPQDVPGNGLGDGVGAGVAVTTATGVGVAFPPFELPQAAKARQQHKTATNINAAHQPSRIRISKVLPRYARRSNIGFWLSCAIRRTARDRSRTPYNEHGHDRNGKE